RNEAVFDDDARKGLIGRVTDGIEKTQEQPSEIGVAAVRVSDIVSIPRHQEIQQIPPIVCGISREPSPDLGFGWFGPIGVLNQSFEEVLIYSCLDDKDIDDRVKVRFVQLQFQRGRSGGRLMNRAA